jgi:Na+/melibiose symporter-like transporter
LLAANAQSPAMADTMRSEGKIYVVVAILVIILLGLIGFVAITDRKVSKIEKQLENKDK